MRGMKTISRQTLVVVFSLLIAVGAGLQAQPLPEKEIYKVRMLTGRAPVEPALVEVRIEIEGWTTPEEVRNFDDILGRRGTDPFLAAYQGANKGVVRFMHSRGWNLPIHAAQFTATEKGKKVRLFLLRQTWNPGSQFATTGRYLFMAIELDLNEKGKGSGRYFEDASLQMDPVAGTIVMDSYASAPKIFPTVQQVIKKAK